MADDAPEQIIINGREFTPEDATRYIELGEKYSELESKLNTSLDKVYPEYTKATQANKQLESELADTKSQLEDLQKKAEVKTEVPEDANTIRENARKYGITTEEYLSEKGYMTKDQVEEYFNARLTQNQNADALLKQCQGLEKDIDGSDGRVPFDTDAVLSYMSAKGSLGQGFATPLEAYSAMNKKGNAKWEEAELAKTQRPGLTTLKPGGKKVPQETKVTFDNFKDRWDEMFPE